MKYKIMVSSQAEVDLRSIYEQVVFVLPEGKIPEKMLDKTESGLRKLEVMEESFEQEEREPWKSRGLWKMKMGDFLVYYIVNEKAKTVTVIRVVHEGTC